MIIYYTCPKCGSKSLERAKTGLEFLDYPEIEEFCNLCGFIDAR